MPSPSIVCDTRCAESYLLAGDAEIRITWSAVVVPPVNTDSINCCRNADESDHDLTWAQYGSVMRSAFGQFPGIVMAHMNDTLTDKNFRTLVAKDNT